MGKIYWNLHEIPIPDGAHINHSDGYVYIYPPGHKNIRTKIGKATSENTMHPNDNFKEKYPALWKSYYPDEDVPAQHFLLTGFYALSLGIGYKTGLYPILQNVYGPQYGNMIMDYCNYSIMDKNNASSLYPNRMYHEVLFSKSVYSDNWLSNFFNEKINEDLNHQFRIEWLNQCKLRGINKVWLAIDGSNNDCTAKKGELPQKGAAKSGKNINIVSYIYAVDVETGTPVTYFVSYGNITDNKAFKKVITFLNEGGIDVEGVILDRGFDTHDVFDMISKSKLKYVIMLRSDTSGHTEMMKRHGKEIRWQVEYCISDKGMFAVQDKVKLFSKHQDESKVTLFFDGLNGSERAATLIHKVLKAYKELKERIDKNESKVSVPKDVSKYILINEDKEGKQNISLSYDNWQKAVDIKGYSTIASSDDLSAGEVDEKYNLRNVSEIQFKILKTQLGFDTTRVHYRSGIENKMAVCFISSIIRNEIVNACKELKLDTNRMIQEIDRIQLIRLSSDRYSAVDDMSERQKKLLEKFDINADSFEYIAEMVNERRTNPVYSQIHKMPSPAEKKKPGRPRKEKKDEEDKPKRKPGRPRGSKNKKTLEKEANGEIKPKRGRGRPKGSKNKPKKEKVKRGRGRPRKQQ